MGRERFSPDEFLTDYWDYQPGEHVTILAPTQNGKTTLLNRLASYSASPQLPIVALIMKPKDEVAVVFIKEQHLRRVQSWPPIPSPWNPTPRGWAVWPRPTRNPDADDANMEVQFHRAITDSYNHGSRILIVDELYGVATELDLDRDMIRVWSRGASNKLGAWVATQKPSHVPLWAYSQAEHLFLGYDPDKRARARFAEIGGVDPDFVYDVVSHLRKYEWLYIQRSSGETCIITADQ